jgi:glycerate dehydrogenase
MRIVVLDGYTVNPGDNPWDRVAALGEMTVYDRTPVEEIVSRAAGADIVLTNKTSLGEEALAKLPHLKFISVLATGYNVVDLQAARRHGIPVSNVPEYSTPAVAQHVFACLLAWFHRVELHDGLVHDGEWTRSRDFCFWKVSPAELAGKRMGIVGFGRIGRRVGELAHAFGMDVLACSRSRGKAPGYRPFEWRTLDQVFAESDVVSLHCPQTADNAGVVNRELLGRMKPTALFVNMARGGLVNEMDLADALNEGRIAGAVLDVLTKEPPGEDNPLLRARNCLITPHMAWAALEARRRLMGITADNIAAFIAGSPVNVVN